MDGDRLLTYVGRDKDVSRGKILGGAYMYAGVGQLQFELIQLNKLTFSK
jgi:hypothetical protein